MLDGVVFNAGACALADLAVTAARADTTMDMMAILIDTQPRILVCCDHDPCHYAV